MSRRDEYSVAVQAAKGTPAAAPQYTLPVGSASMGMERKKIEAGETTGSRGEQAPEYGTRFYKGDVQAAVRINPIGVFLASFTGLPVSTPTAAAHAHVFDPFAGGADAWLTVWSNRKDVKPSSVSDRWNDVAVDSLELTAKVNAKASFKAGLVGISMADGGVPAPSATYDQSTHFKSSRITAAMAVNGGVLKSYDCSEVTLKLENGIKTDSEVLGSDKLLDLPKDNLQVSADIVFKSALAEHYRRAMLDNADECRVVVTLAGNTIAGAEVENIVIELFNYQYDEAPLDIDEGSTLTDVKVKGTAYLSAAGKVFQVRMLNQVASYAGV